MEPTPIPFPGPSWRRSRFAGIRLKLLAFLLPAAFLLVISMAWTVTRISEETIRSDLLQRGLSVSQVVALSSRYSILSEDRLALDSLAAETKNSSQDIEYVAIRDMSDTILAHSIIAERGKRFTLPEVVQRMGTLSETQVDDVIRWGREMIEFTTPIFFTGKRVGTVSLAVSKTSLAAAQRDIRESVAIAALVFLLLALLGTLMLSTVITTPIQSLSAGVQELAGGGQFHPIPVRGNDELAELTRSFNRMAETILRQKDRLQQYAGELEDAYVATVRVLAASIDARDPYTLGHSTRVSALACNLGRRLGFSPEEISHLEKACLFHDVGKIRTPDEILLKERKLTPREVSVMQRHPLDGAEILRMAPSLHRYIPVVRYHHEWYNGKGYPEGIRNSQIPIHAQIIAIADAYDAMTSTRPYRKSLSPDEAVEEILRYRGTQFAPDLTDTFVRMIRESPPAQEGNWRQIRL
ncbi:MAG: hypothetical protein Kow00128_18170 [Deltaproteobacteria bacterium]